MIRVNVASIRGTGSVAEHAARSRITTTLARIIRRVTAIEVQPFRSEGNAAVLLKMLTRRITYESTCEKVKHRAERHA